MDGKVLTANENFLQTLGYTLPEIHGRTTAFSSSPATQERLNIVRSGKSSERGEYDAGQYKRVGKGGREVWIQASYNPILDLNGKPFKVVKYATDVTAQVHAAKRFARRYSRSRRRHRGEEQRFDAPRAA